VTFVLTGEGQPHSSELIGTFWPYQDYFADISEDIPMKTVTSIVIAAGLLLGGIQAAAAQDQATPPAASSDAPANSAVKSPDDAASSPLAKGHNSFTKSQAASRIKKAGYTQVSGLVLDADGLWQASAMRGGQPVKVALDYKGDVAAQ
jgi:hypothetical protein